MDIAVLYLASGLSRRFGSNKLLFPVGGRPLFQYGFCHLQQGLSYVAVPGIHWHVAVVTPYEEIARWCSARGAAVSDNPWASEGQAAAIRIGTKATAAADAWAYFVADRPRLKAATIASFLTGYVRSGRPAGAAAYDGHLGNPAIFSHLFYKELMDLRGDCGAGPVLRRHAKDCWSLPIAAQELEDIDRKEDAQRLERDWQSHMGKP